jgi:hypothetical protein
MDASSADTLITAHNVSITTNGDGSAFGAEAYAGGHVLIDNVSSVTTHGIGAWGLHSTLAGTDPSTGALQAVPSQLDANNVTVTTTGFVSHGAFVYDGAIMNLCYPATAGCYVNITTSGDTA